MAIKISGTTVIDNSQNITNAGIVTATSFTGDGSQLTNLPGGGGNTLEATASGTLADGSKVVVNSDGTVSVVAQTETTGPGVGSQAEFNSLSSVYISAAYDSTNNKVVITYSDWGNSQYGTAVVGTVSGTSISFGTPVVFESAATNYTTTVYDSTNQKIVIGYVDGGNSNYGTAIVGTVSGTSISFGSPVVFNSANTNNSYISGTFDSTNSKIVIAYTNTGNSDYGTAIVGTVSGTSISFGSPTVFESDATYNCSAVYDSSNQKVVIAYRDWNNSERGTSVVGTVSGTSISFGSPVTFGSVDGSQYPTAVYDSSNQKVVIAYRDKGNSYYGTAVVGTVSGTSISFGTPVVFEVGTVQYIGATFDSASGKVVIAYNDTNNGQYGTAVVGTVSGNSISFGDPIVYNTDITYWNSPIFDSTNNKVVLAYNSGTSSLGKASVFSQTGYGAVHQLGSASVFETFQVEDISATYDSANGKVVIAYMDRTSYLDYGTAVVGTVSGTSISFGTPVVFNTARTMWISAVYDSSNEKVVIAYSDRGDSDHGYAIVGTVSGTSISFGSEEVFDNAGATIYISATYDSTNQKVVVAYQGQYSYGRAKVGTVSGDSISFGSSAIFESAQTRDIKAIFDSSNGKVVVAYSDYDGSRYGTAVVGTVSGTSISFGTPVVFESANSQYVSAAYDSTNGKVVIAYHDDANSTYGTAIVGEVSGTSISFGSPTVFNSGGTYNIEAIFDSSTGKVIIAYRDNGNSNYGTVIAGTVSGTSISFGSATVYRSGTNYYIALAYDSSNSKVVICYEDSGNSDHGTAAVFSPSTISRNLTAENFIGISDGAYSDGQTATIQLTGAVDDAQSSLTPGQSYYVQNDGTLSETADNPSVFAGTALASTKLIVRG